MFLTGRLTASLMCAGLYPIRGISPSRSTA
jgi:hypothetical protein